MLPNLTAFCEFTKSDLATLVYFGPNSLGGARIPAGPHEHHTGLLWANKGLLLAREQRDFFAEFICQEKQLANSFGVHRLGSLMT